MKILFISLGCDKNLVDTEVMLGLLASKGFEMTDDEQEADIIVINTCCFIHDAKEESIQNILEMAELKKEGKVKALIVTGCMAERYKDEILEEIPEVDEVLGTTAYDKILDAVDAALEGNQEVILSDIDALPLPETKRLVTTGGHFAYLKIAEGCDKHCTYCIIPYARGRIRSRKAEEVVREVETLAANGCKEVVLTGIHLSSYGLDHGDNLLHLIQEVHKVEGIRRIRLGSLEPGIIDENFVKELAKLEKICPHFHLSLQSGCDATLKRMNRKYDTATYEAGCKLIRKYFTHPAITTDVIVGFPGETEEEFEATKEFLERIHFYEMHIFKYSKRKGTKAAVMPDQVPEQVKTERSKVLLALAQEMSEEFREYYVGRPEEILLEETDEIAGNVYFTGYTKEYVKIAVPEAEGEENILVKGVVTGRISADVYRMENIEKAE